MKAELNELTNKIDQQLLDSFLSDYNNWNWKQKLNIGLSLVSLLSYDEEEGMKKHDWNYVKLQLRQQSPTPYKLLEALQHIN